MKSISIERPVCNCGGFAVLDGRCGNCYGLFKSGRVPCRLCGIPIPQPGENPDPATLLCDECYEGAP